MKIGDNILVCPKCNEIKGIWTGKVPVKVSSRSDCCCFNDGTLAKEYLVGRIIGKPIIINGLKEAVSMKSL